MTVDAASNVGICFIEAECCFSRRSMVATNRVEIPDGSPLVRAALGPERMPNQPTPDKGMALGMRRLREPPNHEPMTDQRKPTFPPIFSPGLHEIRREDFGKVFLDPAFDSPLRQRLTTQLRSFVAELERLGVHGDLWINGSYATKKPAPADIDLVLSIPPNIVSGMSQQSLDRFDFLSDSRNRGYVRALWQVDFYVFKSSDLGRRSYFFDLFSKNPDRSNPKGIPFIKI